jgi:hypothetical protein
MRLTAKQGYALLDKFGSYILELCSLCGKGIGPIRFTRRGDSGAWCSRECRDGNEAHAPGTCRGCGARLPEGKRRGATFCDDACRKAHARVPDGKLSRTNPSIYAGFRSLSNPGSYPHSRKAENSLIADKSAEGVRL